MVAALQYPARVDALILGCTACGGLEAVRADPENAYGEHGLNLGTITGS